jgi:hypothetical protein
VHIPNPFSWRSTLPIVAVALGASALMFIAAGMLHSMEYKKSVALYGLYGVTGKFGRGKSYFLAWLAYDAMKRGRQVYAIKADPPQFNDDKRPMIGGKKGTKLSRPVIELEDWQQIISVPDGSLVLLDEVQLWWRAADRAAPVEVQQWITQLRKHDITVVWASQFSSNVSPWLRKLSFGIFDCAKFRKGHRYLLYECHMMRGEHLARCKSESAVYLRRSKSVQEFYESKAFVTTGVEWGAEERPQRRAQRASTPRGRETEPSIRPGSEDDAKVVDLRP